MRSDPLVHCLGEQRLVAHEHGPALLGDNRREGVVRRIAKRLVTCGEPAPNSVISVRARSTNCSQVRTCMMSLTSPPSVSEQTARPGTGGHEPQEVLEGKEVERLDGSGRGVDGRRKCLRGHVDKGPYPVNGSW